MNAKNNEGNTALILAVRYSQTEVVWAILEALKDNNRFLEVVNAQNKDGKTAWMYIQDFVILKLTPYQQAHIYAYHADITLPNFQQCKAVFLKQKSNAALYSYIYHLKALKDEVAANKDRLQYGKDIEAILDALEVLPSDLCDANIAAKSQAFSDKMTDLKTKLPAAHYDFKVLLLNILIAATGIGLFVIAGYYAKHRHLLFAPASCRLEVKREQLELEQASLHLAAYG